MNIKVNGIDQRLNEAITLEALLILNKVESPEMVSVQLNGNFVKREDFHNTLIQEQDELDFLYFMGGGDSR